MKFKIGDIVLVSEDAVWKFSYRGSGVVTAIVEDRICPYEVYIDGKPALFMENELEKVRGIKKVCPPTCPPGS